MPDEKKDGKKQEQPGRGVYEWAQALVCSVLAAVVQIGRASCRERV